MSSFVVTTSVRGTSRTQIWDSSQPLALGHPFQWIMERTKDGVRVRSLGQTLNQVRKGQLKEISNALLEKGAEIELPRTDALAKTSISLRIRPVRAQAPVFEIGSGTQITVYACAGHWIVQSGLLTEKYVGKVNKKKAISFERKGTSFQLTAFQEGFSLQTAGDRKPLPMNEAVEVSAGDLLRTLVEISTPNGGRYTWRFAMTGNPALPPTIVRGGARMTEEDTLWFKKALQGVAVALAAFVALSWFWPAPKPSEELIPPQFTRLVMTKPPTQAAPAAAGSETASRENAPAKEQQSAPKAADKVQKSAVVQAFRAKALSSAVSGLLRGGMTSLLAQSDFVAGREASAEARRIFDTKSNSLKATGPDVGMLNDRKVNVSALGGSGGSANGKTHAGYGKGEHANVKGQGEAFVSMDVGGAAVDEGLTKDEVGEVIHRHLREVRYCYESAMLRTPDIEGKLMTSFVIGANGMVKTSDVKQSTLPDPRLDDCILRRLMSWQFPKPRGGIDVAVSYPFIFKTLGR